VKLERLVLENFRQFKGRQELVFSDLKSRNVTLVHAENGFGKTTLLKALLWALYGHDGLLGMDGQDQDFERPEHIIHEGTALSAADPNAVFARVQLTFGHDDDRYILTRQISLAEQRLDAKRTKLTLEVMRDGQTFTQDRPQQRVQSIMPAGISKFLFFNGERINYLAAERNREQVTTAIEQMLGLSLLSRTIEDLRHQNVRGRLRGELRDAASDEKRELVERRTSLEADIAVKKEELTTKRKEIEATNKEIETIDAKLVANREAAALQKQRQSLQQEAAALRQQRAEVQQRLGRLIAEDGFTLFTDQLIQRGQEIVGRLRAEGKIPARVLNTFLDDLLGRGVCICDRELPPGSTERAAVERLLTVAGDQDFNNAVAALDHAIGHIQGVRRKTAERLRELNAERLDLTRRIRDCEEELEEIHQKLGSKQDETVQRLEQQRQTLALRENGLHSEVGGIEQAIKTAQEQAAELDAQIRTLEDKQEAAARAQRRLDAVEDCAALLERILAAETQDLRPLLNDEIQRHFARIMTKHYWAELTPDYRLSIKKQVSPADPDAAAEITDVALSTGERTVTSLVFIASLVALAERRAEIPTMIKGLAGSTYPIAIDSPFGSLSVFREGVARGIAELAPQVLLLVSPEQYNGAVESALDASGRVGKRYYLVYHGPSIPDRASPALVVNGEQFQQYVESEREEYTELVELT
jgi:DNA sulfur modification protein DndD